MADEVSKACNFGNRAPACGKKEKDRGPMLGHRENLLCLSTSPLVVIASRFLYVTAYSRARVYTKRAFGLRSVTLFYKRREEKRKSSGKRGRTSSGVLRSSTRSALSKLVETRRTAEQSIGLIFDRPILRDRCVRSLRKSAGI